MSARPSQPMIALCAAHARSIDGHQLTANAQKWSSAYFAPCLCRAQKELQERCQRLVARLPTVPSDPLSSGSEETHSQGTGPSELSPAHSRPGSGPAAISRLSLDSRLSTRVVVPRQAQAQQQPLPQQRTGSGGRQSSRRPPSLNPFDLARSEDGMSVEVIEEDEMEFMVEEVTTPGGTVREVVVHESSSEAPFAAAMPPALKARARSEEIADQAILAGAAADDEAPGAELEFRVASVNDGGEAGAAPNSFAAARATDAVAATSIARPLPAKRRQGSLGMAREDLLSHVGDAADLASAAQGTVFLDALGSGDGSSLAGSEPSSSGRAVEGGRRSQEVQERFSGTPARAPAAPAESGGPAYLQEEGRRASRDSRRSSGESATVSNAAPLQLRLRKYLLSACHGKKNLCKTST